jgi:hypothetical protein
MMGLILVNEIMDKHLLFFYGLILNLLKHRKLYGKDIVNNDMLFFYMQVM